MGPVLSALVVLAALAASAVLLVHLVVTEGRRRDQRRGVGRRGPPTRPRPPAPPRVEPALSSDGAWTWTGSGWVPSWWGPIGAAPPRPAPAPVPARSHGCIWAAGVGCALLLSTAVALVLVGLVLLVGLVGLLVAALGG